MLNYRSDTMQKIKGFLKKLEKNKNWKKELTTYIKDVLENNQPDNNDYKELLKIVADVYVAQDDSEKTKEELSGIINDDELLITIHNFILEIKKWYFDVKLLRSLQTINPYLVNSVLDIIIDDFVIHVNDSCVEKIKSVISEFECDEEQITKCLTAIDYIAEFYAREFLSKSYISSEFSEDSGLEKKCSDHFAELITMYERDLKINYIVKKLKSMD